MIELNYYPGFPYASAELTKFLATVEVVTLMLKSGEIVHYSPVDIESFIQWLRDNNIEDIRTDNPHL